MADRSALPVEAGRCALPAEAGKAGRRRSAPRTPLLAVALAGLLGCWLAAAPFVTGDQPRGARWTGATRNDVALGAALALVSLLTLFGYAAAAVRWLARRLG
jgi:hypothetical protein